MGVTLANAPQSQNSEPADSLPPSNGDSRPSPNQSHYILVLGQRLAETDGKKVATRTSTDRATAAAQAFHDAIEKDSAPGRRPKILLLGGDAASIGVTESELAKALLLGGSADKVTEINGVPVSLEDEDWKSPFPGEISEEDLLLDVRSRFTYTNAIEGVKKMIGLNNPSRVDAHLTLVTSKFHLPRATFIFECVLNGDKSDAMTDAFKEMFIKTKMENDGIPNKYDDDEEISQEFWQEFASSRFTFGGVTTPDVKMDSLVTAVAKKPMKDLHPDTWKNSNIFNRLERINWELMICGQLFDGIDYVSDVAGTAHTVSSPHLHAQLQPGSPHTPGMYPNRVDWEVLILLPEPLKELAGFEGALKEDVHVNVGRVSGALERCLSTLREFAAQYYAEGERLSGCEDCGAVCVADRKGKGVVPVEGVDTSGLVTPNLGVVGSPALKRVKTEEEQKEEEAAVKSH